ncbi:antibiotic biosynthesis monooxygenase family protein [Hydrocarboniclastica marina]|uniref:Antibiotic biosynthesis monooxygenase n=1 Tax=Hydrocarboniclastica marina TaxID=2259620 RepID=A0A4V1D8L8_9ALTE|nr:antibiotic biosynthesis monooxygenase family protein [Hydrocarboniclastica marina]MAL98613.1 antibiotic biosynthesis monooxygenase [Alteromonadaceae bacterium]QCF25640.1 antibiotic biosynthesis monooxygenase [Hydrocarboniclastica marina]|tara:strand:+ start:827 stop:1111 length:285 start_codon:yes stop_codon:yes gene_type:complete
MIKIMIERHIAPTLEIPYEERARNVLQTAVKSPGFISGETYRNAQDPNHRFLISTWRSLADWKRWESSLERRVMMEPLFPMMDREERITTLEFS